MQIGRITKAVVSSLLAIGASVSLLSIQPAEARGGFHGGGYHGGWGGGYHGGGWGGGWHHHGWYGGWGPGVGVSIGGGGYYPYYDGYSPYYGGYYPYPRSSYPVYVGPY